MSYRSSLQCRLRPASLAACTCTTCRPVACTTSSLRRPAAAAAPRAHSRPRATSPSAPRQHYRMATAHAAGAQPDSGTIPPSATPEAAPQQPSHLQRMLAMRPDLTLATSDGMRISVHRAMLVLSSPVLRRCVDALVSLDFFDEGCSISIMPDATTPPTLYCPPVQLGAVQPSDVAAAGMQLQMSDDRAAGNGELVLLVEGTGAEWQALLPFLYPNASVSMTYELAAQVITIAHRYDIIHLKDACTAFLTSEANPLSGSPDSPAYALSWLRTADALKLDGVAKRCEDYLEQNLKTPTPPAGGCGRCGSDRTMCTQCGCCPSCKHCRWCGSYQGEARAVQFSPPGAFIMDLVPARATCWLCGCTVHNCSSPRLPGVKLSTAVLSTLQQDTLVRLLRRVVPCEP